MSDKQEKRYLYINGQAVPVSEQVYQAYHHYERKEEYFTYDLKAEQFTCDQEAQTATFTPSREDSYERLLAAKTQFPSVGPSVEEQTIARLDMKALMRDLTEEERGITAHFILALSSWIRNGKLTCSVVSKNQLIVRDLPGQKTLTTGERNLMDEQFAEPV